MCIMSSRSLYMLTVLRMETLLGVSELVSHQETANLVRNLQKRNMSKVVDEVEHHYATIHQMELYLSIVFL